MKRLIVCIISISVILFVIPFSGCNVSERGSIGEATEFTVDNSITGVGRNEGDMTIPEQETAPATVARERYTIYEIDHSDGASGAEHRIEYTLNLGGSTTDATAPKKASATFLGLALSGTYSHSMTSDLFPHDVNSYITDDRDLFWLDAQTGELRCLMMHTEEDSSTPKQSLTREECVSLAEKFLTQVIDDFDKYTLVESRIWGSGNTYYFGYCRQIGGLDSMDTISVGIRPSGQLDFYDIRSYGTLQGVELPSSYNKAAVDETVRAKLDRMYASVAKDHSLEFSEKRRCVVRLPNGSIGLLIDIDTAVTFTEMDSFTMHELTEFVVILD